MGKRKRTPLKRKRSVGRPRKKRLVTPSKGPQHQYIGNDMRMSIALLAQAGQTPSEIADNLGCNYKTAVDYSGRSRPLCEK